LSSWRFRALIRSDGFAAMRRKRLMSRDLCLRIAYYRIDDVLGAAG
jgi:hypothetical protein